VCKWWLETKNAVNARLDNRNISLHGRNRQGLLDA
jgi:hypothetical protein